MNAKTPSYRRYRFAGIQRSWCGNPLGEGRWVAEIGDEKLVLGNA